MWQVGAFGAVLVASSVVSACATTPSARSTLLSETVTAPRPEQRAASTTIGSRVVEEVPMRAGPRASIRADVSNEADSRRVRGVFRVDDDAYVIVGHIDADGVLRIAFPSDPQDDGFVRGNRSYQTHEFFAGFNSQYRFRARASTIWNTVAAQDAYDGGFGYVFIIAAWRPMRFDRFSDGYRWDTFDLVSDSYMNDPRPAIQELASRLAGDNGDAYTVQFARYTNTQVVSSDYYPIASAYDVGFCSGYRPYGFASYGYARYGYPMYSGFGYNMWYRGSRYYYDSFGDCYRSYSPWGFGVQYRIVQVPVIPPPRNQPRIFDFDGHRPMPVPRALPGHVMPQAGQTAPGEAQIEHRTAVEYRERTTPTNDGNQTGPARRQPRIDAPMPVEHRDRPMVQEAPRRAEPREQPQPRMTVPERVDRPERATPPPSRFGLPRAENAQPEPPRRESPRIEAPRENPRTAPRTESPRVAMPRSEAPRSEPQRSEPARQSPPRAESPKPESRSEPPRSATPRTEPRKPPR